MLIIYSLHQIHKDGDDLIFFYIHIRFMLETRKVNLINPLYELCVFSLIICSFKNSLIIHEDKTKEVRFRYISCWILRLTQGQSSKCLRQ